MRKIEALNIIRSLTVTTHAKTQFAGNIVEQKDSKSDYYSAATDRWFEAKRELPNVNISEEAVYSRIMVDSGLDKYFSEEEFKEVYYETRNSNPSLHSFYFDTEFIQTLLEYVYYKEYLETANEKISFFHFLKNNLYRTMKQDEQYQTWKEETEKKQDNFTSKTNQELKKLYEKDKHFIDHNYQIHVELIDCMDIIPFSMFLQMYDLADRNYYNENTNIDERLTRIIMERYYEFFIVTNNYQNKISYGDFKQIFNKSKNMFEKLMKEQELKTEEEQKESPNFKNIITQMIEERISALDENINIELLHKQKRK